MPKTSFVQSAQMTNELKTVESKPISIPVYVPPQIMSGDEVNWCEWKLAIRDTLRLVRERASKTNEPKEITRKKLDAIRAHDPTRGDVVVCNLGTEDSPIFKGIPIRKKLTSQ